MPSSLRKTKGSLKEASTKGASCIFQSGEMSKAGSDTNPSLQARGCSSAAISNSHLITAISIISGTSINLVEKKRKQHDKSSFPNIKNRSHENNTKVNGLSAIR
jgi:hypothetical protein